MKKAILYFAAALLGGVVVLTSDRVIFSGPATSAGTLPANYSVRLAGLNAMAPEASIDFIRASETALPAVVHVKTETSPTRNMLYYYDPFQDRIWNRPDQQRPQVGTGSGVIIAGEGYIVTNAHVIKGADKVFVTLHDKRSYTAKVIGSDPATDIALLKIDEQNLPYLLYGNSDQVKVGEWVLAVGNPFNLTSTVTAGIVSAKARNINILEGDPAQGLFPVESFIQTDAAVNPGNSGGALVNTQGLLVGINSAIASNTGSYTGYSFAIPVNLARKVVNDLLEFGKVQRAYLGVSIRDVDSRLKEEKGLNLNEGVYVSGLTEEGAANKAGLMEGDVIIKVGEAPVSNVPELQEQIGRYRPGDKISVMVRRGGEERAFLVTLKNRSGDTMLSRASQSETINLLGGIFEEVNQADKQKLGIASGVKIKSLAAGKLRSAGIREGFIITSIDKKRVSSLDEIRAALENKEGGVLIEGVYSNGTKAYYAFGL